MQPFVSEIINGKAIGMTNKDLTNQEQTISERLEHKEVERLTKQPKPVTNQTTSPEWEKEFDQLFQFNAVTDKRLKVKKYRAVYLMAQTVHPEAIKSFIRKTISQAVSEAEKKGWNDARQVMIDAIQDNKIRIVKPH